MDLLLKQISVWFCFKNMGKHTQSVDSKVIGRIRGKGRGWVFTPADFQDLGSRTAVGLALMRHTRGGTIRQLDRGLYDYPASESRLGLLAPSTDAVAEALKGRDASHLQPTGAYAANMLGLSEQVPMKTVFLTDGPSRRVKLGKREILIKHTTTRNMVGAGTISGLVIQALRWIGRGNVDARKVAILRNRIPDADRQRLLNDVRYAPAWVADVLRKIAAPEEG